MDSDKCYFDHVCTEAAKMDKSATVKYTASKVLIF